ncbi:MAG: ATP-dependent zinc metalloprotease FtsH [Oscillospiraceae bacterium]
MQNKGGKGRGVSLIFVAAMLVMMMLMFRMSETDTVKYSKIVDEFNNNNVTEFELNTGNGKLTYRLKTDKKETPVHSYSVPNVDIFLADVRPGVIEYNETHPNEKIEYNYIAASNWGAIIINFLPIVLIIGMLVSFYFMMGKQGGGNIGKAKTRTPEADDRKATFADVAGADEEKEELSEIVEYLKNPSRFKALGANIPKGVLLVGPPGTGKTLLARAVAGEAGVPFYSISGSNFVELYVGVGASRVRDLFEKAKKTRPSIIFIDEIDAVGRKRGAGLGGGNDEREQTLNQLLVEMDGFSGNEGVIVIAATNRSDVLDQALLRPGRFDRTIYVGYPDVKGREEILKVHARGKPMGPDVDFVTIAKSTPGFTGADLENLLNEAALLAARKNRKAIVEEDIEEASIKVFAGPEKKSRIVSEKKKKLVAYHEAGHAIATFYATPEKPVHQISIVPRGEIGGFTMSLPDDETGLVNRSDLMNEIVTLLGGRVAEKIVFDDISTGASNDLERATTIAHDMVTRYGFSDKLGPIVYDSHDEVFLGRDFTQSRNYSEQVASSIDTELRGIIDKSYNDCYKLISNHIDQLKLIADRLVEAEKIDSDEFKKLMNGEIVPLKDEVKTVIPAADLKIPNQVNPSVEENRDAVIKDDATAADLDKNKKE